MRNKGPNSFASFPSPNPQMPQFRALGFADLEEITKTQEGGEGVTRGAATSYAHLRANPDFPEAPRRHVPEFQVEAARCVASVRL